MPRIGLVGAGFIAGIHADRYRTLEDAAVSAVLAPDGADAFVSEHGLDAQVFTDPETFFAERSFDVLDICSPTHTHRQYVEWGAELGLPIICEKPLAPTVADAEACRAATDAAGVPLLVGHVLRYFPAYQTLRQRVVDGAVGTVGTIRARRHSPYPDWGDWFGADEKSGGIFVDLGIHEFDLCRWCLGSVERVFARRRSWETGQHGHATLRFASGAVGYVEAGWDRPADGDLESEFEVAGDEGLLEYDSTTGAALTVDREGSPVPPERTASRKRDGYARELDAFLAAIDRGETPRVTPADAVAAVRLAVAANRSAERGAPVTVAEVGP